MIEDVIKDMESKCKKGIELLQKELNKMRTGRANLSILDGIKVLYYGSPTPLNQIAALTVVDPKLIVIKPYDKAVISDIEKAIIAADIGINPNNDGEVVRLPVPPLSGERRKEMVKLIKKHGEETKVLVRNQRRDANEQLKEDKTIPEDDLHKALKKIQDLTDKYIKEIDRLIEQKEKEIIEF